jgi:small subunit ribosomal protein S17
MKETPTQPKGMQLEGTVVSDTMALTAVVSVAAFKKHPKYGKFMQKNKRYKAHNPENTYKVGDKVRMQSCRPLSKGKHFMIVEKIGHAKGAALEVEFPTTYNLPPTT